MSRNSVLTSTISIIDSINNPKVQEGWAKLKALMRVNETFDHMSDLLAPTLLSQQSGSYGFHIKLTLREADELGRGRGRVLETEEQRSQKINYSSRVIIRCFKVQPDGEVKTDCFPPNSSIRVNDVFHQRLERKEGPIDITSSVKVNPMLTNDIKLDVPSPTGFYVFTVMLVRALTATNVVKRLSTRHLRCAEVTKGKIRRYHELSSSDLAVTSTTFSLVCPLTQKRFEVPAQGENCNHLSCFDLYTYLKINARSGKWMCPICNLKVLPQNLVVDGYWKEVVDLFIKENNSSSTVRVTDEGTWNESTSQCSTGNSNALPRVEVMEL